MRALRVLSAALAVSLAGASAQITTLYGFTTISSDHERQLESAFLDVPSAAGALETGLALATQPHPPGSPADYKTATYLRDQLQSFGFITSIETLAARVDTPKSITLTLYPTGHAPATASKADTSRGIFSRPKKPPAPKAAPTPTRGPASGPVALQTPEPVAPVPLDLREPPIASDPDTANPAIGVPFLAGSADGDVVAPIVYAGHGTEADYALLTGHDVDPRGAILIVRNGREFRGITARRAQAHGAAAVLFYDDPGDDGPGRGGAYPFGPFRPATSVRRGTVGEGVTIPVEPISAANALALLGSIHGPTAPPPWRGTMAVGYPFARGPATAHLSVHLTRKPVTLWNTIGFLPGVHPEQTVLLGAHRDAWVFGAGDNASGVETLVETARGLGYLTKGGWRPQRTIVVAGWDGEEYGSYGTFAYVRKHGDELRLGGVAYLDAEQTVTGPQFGADAVAAIAGTVADATHAVDDPQAPGTTLYDRWARFSRTFPTRTLDPIGSHAPSSLFGIGVPSANAGFSGPFGVDHSAYDTNTFANTFADPQFALHRTAAQLYGVIALRLADADVVPYRFGAYVPPMQAAVRALGAAAKTGKLQLDAAGFGTSIARLAAAAKRFDAATANAANEAATDRALEAARVLDVAAYGNDGYASVTLPEIAHAVAGGDQGDIDRAVGRTRGAIDRATELLAP